MKKKAIIVRPKHHTDKNIKLSKLMEKIIESDATLKAMIIDVQHIEHFVRSFNNRYNTKLQVNIIDEIGSPIIAMMSGKDYDEFIKRDKIIGEQIQKWTDKVWRDYNGI